MIDRLSAGRGSIESSTSPLLRMVESGLTTTLAISLAAGLSERSVLRLTEEQREILDGLLKNYKVAIKIVNAETIKGRL